MRKILITATLLLIGFTCFSQGTENVTNVVEGMQWVSFLTPLIVWAATELSRLVKKLPAFATLIIVAALSSVTGYLMQLGEQTEHWYFTALIGLGSVFVNELRKSLK